jgi:hypothetical protein
MVGTDGRWPGRGERRGRCLHAGKWQRQWDGKWQAGKRQAVAGKRGIQRLPSDQLRGWAGDAQDAHRQPHAHWHTRFHTNPLFPPSPPPLQDHYKLALGQINMCRNLIDRICHVRSSRAGCLGLGRAVQQGGGAAVRLHPNWGGCGGAGPALLPVTTVGAGLLVPCGARLPRQWLAAELAGSRPLPILHPSCIATPPPDVLPPGPCVPQDYVRLLKYGDSLYRCKQLKRAALGRMCTLMKRQGPSLQYLEQARLGGGVSAVRLVCVWAVG